MSVEAAFPQTRYVRVDHHRDQVLEADRRAPTELLSRLGRVALKQGDLSRAIISLIDDNVFPPVEPDALEGQAREFLDAVGFSGGDHEVVRLGLLEHQLDGANIITGEAPIAARLEIAEGQCLLP